jgi:selenium-binding protein 1
MVEVSRDGRRVYVTNSLYGSWDPIFYPDGVGAWMAKLDANPEDGGGLTPTPLLPQRRRLPRPAGHQTRLQAGDASSDSYCHTR